MTRQTGTASDVISAFVDGRELRTRTAPVPGGARVRSEAYAESAAGMTALYSYRTVVAVRTADGAVALTPRRYSVTTSKLMSHVRGALIARGYVPTDDVQTVRAAVPGRWGGFGPAWHATGSETLPFQVWRMDGAEPRCESCGEAFAVSSDWNDETSRHLSCER